VTERLQKIIAAAGVCSRRAAEKLISDGRVTVNGKTAVLGQSADVLSDNILADGRPIVKTAEYLYILLNKPRGYVTTLKDERGRKNVSQLVQDCGARVYPCGRLDMATEGLLILTNDGDFANRLTHPSNEIRKTYKATVTQASDAKPAVSRADPSSDEHTGGTINIRDAIGRLSKPFVLDGYTTRPAEVRLLEYAENRAVLEITIREGRNRQIRRMCEAAGLRVLRLVRTSEGGVCLGKLRAGEWRHMTESEVLSLKNISNDSENSEKNSAHTRRGRNKKADG